MTTLVNLPAAPSMALPRPPHARLRGLTKRFVWFGATLLALEILYLVVANLFLRFGLLPILNRDPDELLIRYERAYTLWPSVARVRGFHLRSQNPGLQWQLEVAEADLTVDLPDLLHKTFSVTRLRATGVAFRLRRRLDSEGVAAPRAGALAPIDGLEDPPLKPFGPPEPPVSDTDYDEWRVRLDDGDVLAHEVWLEEYRLTGGIRARGGLYLIPDRLLHVGITGLDVEHGEVQIGERVVVSPLDAHIDSLLGVLDMRGSREKALREISGHAELDARTPGMEFLRLYLGDPPALRLEDGSGSLHLDAHVTNGRVTPRTKVTFQSDHLVLGADKYTATLDYRVEVRVENAASEPLATGDLVIHRAVVRREGAEGRSPILEDARAHILGLPRDLAGPYEIAKIELDLPAKIPDLRWLLPAPDSGESRPVKLAGSGAIRARVDLDRTMRAAGTVEASAEGVEVKAPRFQISGRLSTTAHFHDADPESKSLVLDPSVLVAKDIAVTRGNRTHGGGTLRVDVTGGRLDHGVPRDLALTLAARAPDLAWLDWHNPPAGDPRLTALTASLNAKIKIPWPASLLDGTKEEAAITGSLALSGTGDARFKGTTLRGDVDATAELQRLDLGRAQLELRALRAVTRDLTVYRKGPPTRGWWSRFDGSRLDVDTKTGLRLDLRGAVRCKDGAPFNAILASEGVIPGWVGTLFPMKGLTASGELRRSHEKLDLGLRARGSSAEVTVRLHDIGKAMSGAVKVETKLVSIGVGFREGKSDVKVLAGEEWLKARISEANAKEAEDQSTTPASTGTAR